MKHRKTILPVFILLFYMVLLSSCASEVDRGVYHFNWVVKVVEPNSEEKLPDGATTMTMARKDWNEENGRWEIMAYSVCYDLADMEYEMSLMMKGLTDYVVGEGPVWPRKVYAPQGE
jgi:hypothetical protein